MSVTTYIKAYKVHTSIPVAANGRCSSTWSSSHARAPVHPMLSTIAGIWAPARVRAQQHVQLLGPREGHMGGRHQYK
jgi:hypothetical protein